MKMGPLMKKNYTRKGHYLLEAKEIKINISQIYWKNFHQNKEIILKRKYRNFNLNHQNLHNSGIKKWIICHLRNKNSEIILFSKFKENLLSTVSLIIKFIATCYIIKY